MTQPEMTDEEKKLLTSFIMGIGINTPIVKALEVILPVMDAGVDVLAMEGYSKSEEFRTIESQMILRASLVDGIIYALQVIGMNEDDFATALANVERSGMPSKNNEEQIIDRMTVWDELTTVNMLYGPKLVGKLMTRNFETKAEDNGSPNEE